LSARAVKSVHPLYVANIYSCLFTQAPSHNDPLTEFCTGLICRLKWNFRRLIRLCSRLFRRFQRLHGVDFRDVVSCAVCSNANVTQCRYDEVTSYIGQLLSLMFKMVFIMSEGPRVFQHTPWTLQ